MVALLRAFQIAPETRIKLLLVMLTWLGLFLSGCSNTPEPAFTPAPAPGEPPQPLKISVPAPGLARIPRSDLDAWRQSALADPQKLQLSFRGVSVPFWVDADGKALTFYAQESDSLYTRESVYLLSFGEPLTPTQTSDIPFPTPGLELPPNLPPGSYFALQRAESNQLYLPQAEGDERWFWQSLIAPASQEIEVQVSDLAFDSGDATPARLGIALWSGSESPKSPDHHLRVLVNGQPVADERWDGKGLRLISAEFSPSILTDGVNRITLDTPGDTGVTADLNYLDWLELGYPRRLLAQDDRLDFWSQGGALRLEGFSGAAAVYDITDPLKPQLMSIQSLGDGSILLETLPGRRYLALGAGGYQQVASLTPYVVQPDLRAPGLGADYLAIAPPDLLPALQPLLEARAAEGFRVTAIPLDAVYDQFNFGMPEPQAIQRMLRYAAANWQPAPRFLLLVGDASYDPKGYLAPPEANRLPTFLVDTVYGGQTASDVAFVELDDDDLPDLALGRIPARTPEQVSAVVAKTLRYERGLNSETVPYRLLAVADGQEPSFKADAEAWLELFPDNLQTEVLSPPPGASDAASQIQTRLKEGESWVAYFGHGSINMWGKDRLFTAEDASRLDNLDNLPVVLNMTCLTGLFTHPRVESLTEALLFNPNGGAVAVLAPSSLTLAYDQSFLSQPLVKEMLARPDARLGEIHLAARRQIDLDSPGKRDVMMTFMLFGDPALRLPPLTQ